ncbi:MAG: zinc-dependent alcohol dehydrogenase family protein [Chloroflexota bacterium]
MRGLVFLGDKQLELRSYPDPVPGPGEVVLEIKASGICGSDLPPYRAPRNRRDPGSLLISGHEPCGVVAAVGDDVRGVQVGERVMQHHYAGCGRCKYCRVGYTQLCLQGHKVYGFTANGSNADYMVCGAKTLVPLPEALTFEEGAALACGTGTAYSALKRLDVSGRDTLAIFGQGPVGLSATLLARAMGARVIAVDVVPARLEMARAQGAEVTLNAAEVDPIQAIRELTHGEGADAALDATGNPEARVQAVRSTRVFGRACLVGEGNTTTFDVSPDIIHRQLTLYGSWTFSSVGLEEAARFVADRGVGLRSILTRRFSLDEAAAAFAYFAGGAPGKSLFVPDLTG